MEIKKRQIMKIHEHEGYVIPLVSTFAFSGAELWCPFCGHTYGIFNAEPEVSRSPMLETIRMKYKEHWVDFLDATGMIMGGGRKVDGYFADHDEETQAKWKADINSWKSEFVLDGTPKIDEVDRITKL